MVRRWWWLLLVMGLIGPVLGLLAAAAVTYVMPKKYESVAMVQVMSGSGQMAADGTAEPMHSMPGRFMATECEVIKAKKTLELAADRLDLTMRWGVDRELAVELLREMIDTEILGGTDLITIRVRHTDAGDARDIAMEVTNAYLERRLAFEEQRASQADSGEGRSPRSPVVIREQPVPARAPVSPNVGLNLVLGLVVGLPLGLLLAFPLMLLLDRTRSAGNGFSPNR